MPVASKGKSMPVRTQAVGLLAAGLAHDLNNMLAAIITTIELVAERSANEDDRLDLQSAVDQAARASQLIRQLLAFSRQETLNPVVVDLSAIMLALQQNCTATVGRDIRLDLVAAPPVFVKIDTTAFERILVNLLLNARNAIRECGRAQGRIRVSCRRLTAAELPSNGRSFMPDKSYGCLTVEDNGPGIAPDIAARIFDPYFTTRDSGHGLGLSSAFGLVKQSGGFLLCDDSLLGGARFSIYLPEVAEEIRPTTVPRKGCGNVIMLVDDELLLRMSAARALERLGFRVRQAADGEAALARLETERPALLISDIRMPGIDGVELARRARAHHPGLPVLLVSGFADERARVAIPGVEAGFLEKPFTTKRLEEAVLHLLDHGNAHPASH